METKFPISFINAKVIKSPVADSVVTVSKTKNGDEFASFLVADIANGSTIKMLCFDKMCSKIQNMKMVPGQDTVSGAGMFNFGYKTENGKRIQFACIKVLDIEFGPRLDQKEPSKKVESEALEKADIFGDKGITSGRSFG